VPARWRRKARRGNPDQKLRAMVVCGFARGRSSASAPRPAARRMFSGTGSTVSFLDSSIIGRPVADAGAHNQIITNTTYDGASATACG